MERSVEHIKAIFAEVDRLGGNDFRRDPLARIGRINCARSPFGFDLTGPDSSRSAPSSLSIGVRTDGRISQVKEASDEERKRHAVRTAARVGSICALSGANHDRCRDVTCEQLVLMKVADPDQIAIWLSGYYNGKRNTTTVDVEQLKETARKVRSHCLYNKGTVMEAVESLLATTK